MRYALALVVVLVALAAALWSLRSWPRPRRARPLGESDHQLRPLAAALDPGHSPEAYCRAPAAP